MGEKLRECPNPWCNSHKVRDAEIRAAEAPILMPSKVSFEWAAACEWAVACLVCPMQTPWFATKAEATAAWNARSQPEDAWRPIESAPKHGTRILALWPYGKQQCAFETYWDADESQGDKPGWYAPGWGHILDGHEPIGWQPLPAPPATGGEDAPA